MGYENINPSQITSKCHDMRLKIIEFNEIFMSLTNLHKNESNEFHFFSAAMELHEKSTPTRKSSPTSNLD